MTNEISEDSANTGLELVFLANKTSDDINRIQNEIALLSSLAISDVSDTLTAAVGWGTKYLEGRLAMAEDIFGMQVEEAALFLGRSAENDALFLSNYKQRELNKLAKTSEKLQALPEQFRELAIAQYHTMSQLIGQKIQQGKLPEAYQLPRLSTFAERLTALAPIYDYMDASFWRPELLFTPRGLSFDQWNSLLQGHTTSDGHESRGITWGWEKYANTLHDSSIAWRQNIRWDVAVVSGLDRPVLLDVSKDGSKGSNSGEIIRTFKKIPKLKIDNYHEGTISRLSPQMNAYYTLQWLRLEKGLTPVDTETITLGRESVTVDGQRRTIVFQVSLDERRVKSFYKMLASAQENQGIRPCFVGSDLATN